MGKHVRFEGVVLNIRPLGESDLLVTIFTKEIGKIKAIAKGAKRSKRRFLNTLEPFTCIKGDFAPPRNASLYRIDSADIVQQMDGISASSERYCLASLVCELTDLWSKEEDPDKQLYSLLLNTLSCLSKGKSPFRTVLGFKINILKCTGYKLLLDQCVVCKKEPSVSIYFSISRGGAVCKACFKEKEDLIGISKGCLKCIQFLQRSNPANFGRLHLSQALFEEMWNLLAQFHIYYLRKSPSSYKVLADFLNFKRVKSVT